MNIGSIAHVVHEANRAWCLSNGDSSQPAWEDVPPWQRESTVKGVQFHIENPDAGDSESHDNWMAQKIADGWVYGTRKDPDATPPTHPCILPFESLSDYDQIKDRLFRSIVHAIIPK